MVDGRLFEIVALVDDDESFGAAEYSVARLFVPRQHRECCGICPNGFVLLDGHAQDAGAGLVVALADELTLA